jgi:hypothetical protein
VLLAAVGVSLAAQVAQAHPSVWGWTVAALPALGLLAVVKIVLSRTTPDRASTASRSACPSERTDDRTTTSHGQTTLSRSHPQRAAPSDRTVGRAPRTGQPAPAAGGPASHPDRTGHRITTAVRSATEPTPDRGQARTEDCGPDPALGRTSTTTPPHDLDLIELGQAIAADLHRQQRPLTRATLTAGIRATGHTISTDKATALLRQLKTNAGHTTADTQRSHASPLLAELPNHRKHPYQPAPPRPTTRHPPPHNDRLPGPDHHNGQTRTTRPRVERYVELYIHLADPRTLTCEDVRLRRKVEHIYRH